MNGRARLAVGSCSPDVDFFAHHLLVQAKETSGLFGDVRVRKDETLALTMTLTHHAGQNRTCPEEVCVVVEDFRFSHPVESAWDWSSQRCCKSSTWEFMDDGSMPSMAFLSAFRVAASAADVGVA